MAEGLYPLGIVFALSLLITSVLYLAGRALGARGSMSEAGLSPYACGEHMPPIRPRMDMSKFFTYVLLFLAFDITVPIVALAILGHYLQATVYLAIILMAISTPALYLRELVGR